MTKLKTTDAGNASEATKEPTVLPEKAKSGEGVSIRPELEAVVKIDSQIGPLTNGTIVGTEKLAAYANASAKGAFDAVFRDEASGTMFQIPASPEDFHKSFLNSVVLNCGMSLKDPEVRAALANRTLDNAFKKPEGKGTWLGGLVESNDVSVYEVKDQEAGKSKTFNSFLSEMGARSFGVAYIDTTKTPAKVLDSLFVKPSSWTGNKTYLPVITRVDKKTKDVRIINPLSGSVVQSSFDGMSKARFGRVVTFGSRVIQSCDPASLGFQKVSPVALGLATKEIQAPKSKVHEYKIEPSQLPQGIEIAKIEACAVHSRNGLRLHLNIYDKNNKLHVVSADRAEPVIEAPKDAAVDPAKEGVKEEVKQYTRSSHKVPSTNISLSRAIRYIADSLGIDKTIGLKDPASPEAQETAEYRLRKFVDDSLSAPGTPSLVENRWHYRNATTYLKPQELLLVLRHFTPARVQDVKDASSEQMDQVISDIIENFRGKPDVFVFKRTSEDAPAFESGKPEINSTQNRNVERSVSASTSNVGGELVASSETQAAPTRLGSVATKPDTRSESLVEELSRQDDKTPNAPSLTV